MKSAFTILLHIIFSSAFSQEVSEVRNLILKDTLNMDSTYTKYVKSYVEKLESEATDSSNMFPFSAFDSIICYQVNKSYFDSEETEEFDFIVKKNSLLLGSTVTIPGKRLSRTQTETLLKTINDPLSYEWGFCGTPIPKYGFVFYSKGKIVAYFDIGCRALNQINRIYPEYFKIREGALNLLAAERLKQIAVQLKILK